MAEGDLREFIRDVSRRHERIWREQQDELHEMRTEIRAMREQSRAESREVVATLRELREESRAHTRAFLHVLDRMDEGGAAA